MMHVVQCSKAQGGTVPRSVLWCSIVHRSTVQCGTYSAILGHSTGHRLCNTVRPVQCSHAGGVRSYSAVLTVSYIYSAIWYSIMHSIVRSNLCSIVHYSSNADV